MENHSEITQECQKLANVNKDESPLEQEVGEKGVGLPEGNLMLVSRNHIPGRGPYDVRLLLSSHSSERMQKCIGYIIDIMYWLYN